MDALVYGPGEGELHDAGAARILIKASGEHTGGSFFLSESTLAPGFAGPPPHRHRELHDMFYVLDGTLTLRLGDRTIEAGPGSFACVPPGVVHTFRNDSDDVRHLPIVEDDEVVGMLSIRDLMGVVLEDSAPRGA